MTPFRLPKVDIRRRPLRPLRAPLPPTPALERLGVILRGETPGDLAFIYGLYRASRAAEMAMVSWDEATRADFVEKQFEYQYRDHSLRYPAMDHIIIVLQGRPIGRIYLNWAVGNVHVVDLALLEECRDRGIGAAVISSLLLLAGQIKHTVSLNVEMVSRARRLYARLGFQELPGLPRAADVAMCWSGATGSGLIGV